MGEPGHEAGMNALTQAVGAAGSTRLAELEAVYEHLHGRGHRFPEYVSTVAARDAELETGLQAILTLQERGCARAARPESSLRVTA